MADVGGAVFWSYSHADNDASGGDILRLANLISDAYSLSTGTELALFVDTDIKWGEQWRNRIDGALSQTTFFMPVLTPRYFNRPECTREFLEFHARVDALGIRELILPILYIPIDDFTDTNPNQTIAVAATYQAEIWTELRLMSTTETEHKTAVHRLAQRLKDANATVRKRQLEAEVIEAQSADGEQADSVAMGLADVNEILERDLPTWCATMETNEVGRAQHDATWRIYGPRLMQAERARQSGAIFALLQKCGIEELPLAERHRASAREYAKGAIALDPTITRLLMILREHPDATSQFESLWEALSTAEAGIKRDRREEVERQYTRAAEFWTKRSHVSRLSQRLAQLYSDANADIEDGHSIATRWLAARDQLISDEGPSPASG